MKLPKLGVKQFCLYLGVKLAKNRKDLLLGFVNSGQQQIDYRH